MITLKTLYWNNCFSYGPDNFIDLSENNLTQIIGFNGAGKSSIPLIIEEVLFNKNSKGIKKIDIPNRYINNGYDITLEFSKDSINYRVEVVRKASIKVKLFKEDEDISSHTATGTYKTIQDILGMDFKTFSQLVYQHPKSSLEFLTATDTNRKKFLIDLLNLQEYLELFQVFKDSAKNVADEKLRVESKVNTLEKWLENNNLKDTTILPLLNLDIQKEVDEEEIGKLNSEISYHKEINQKIAKNNQYKKMLASIKISEFQDIKNKQIKSYDGLQEEKGTIQATISTAQKLIDKLSSLGDTCHVCGQNVDTEFNSTILKEALKNKTEAYSRINEIDSEIAEIKKDNAELLRKRAKQKEWEELYNNIDNDLSEEPLNLDESIARLNVAKKKLEEYETELNKRYIENNKRSEHNTRVKVVEEQGNEFNAELKVLKTQVTILEEDSANLEVLKKAFSTNGLLAYKIENLVKELEEIVNEYLAELSDGRFALEFKISQDKLNVDITDYGKEVNILSLSSGELAKVNTSTLLAIRRLMSSLSSSKINVLFLDEVISVLDELGKERLVEVLLKENDLNTYAVSHGYTHPLVSKIEVVNENNTSRLVA